MEGPTAVPSPAGPKTPTTAAAGVADEFFDVVASTPLEEHTSNSSVDSVQPTVSVPVSHNLEWHVQSYIVPSKKGPKAILRDIGRFFPSIYV